MFRSYLLLSMSHETLYDAALFVYDATYFHSFHLITKHLSDLLFVMEINRKKCRKTRRELHAVHTIGYRQFFTDNSCSADSVLSNNKYRRRFETHCQHSAEPVESA